MRIQERCSCGAEFQAEDDRQLVSKRFPDGSGTDYAVDAAERWRSTHLHTELAVAVSDEGPKEAT